MWQRTGFFQDSVNVNKSIDKLDLFINSIPELYKKVSIEQILQKPAPGKWSKQEILGHLIDSAINNLKRFTEVQFLPQPYKVVSYKQNELVEVNRYQGLPLEHLLSLWKALNQQIVYVVKNISAGKLEFPVDPQYDNGEMRTLGWIICDYVAHMEHHLKQITGK